ncbi:neural cell adhesion molecule 1 isoform X2 [Thalassophryne amazonica]|nr:neural cell adhesion molecule 1 isoform X2 [Thalassophryne amazonica]
MDIITSKKDVPVGEEILLLCKTGKEGDVTWQKDNEDVEEEKVTKMDEISSKLLIRKATLQDSGRYTCVCDFDSGSRSEVSVQLYVHDGPTFQDTVTYHEFIEGSDAVVPCLVSGKPALEIQWLRDQKVVPLYASSSGMRVYQMADNTLRIGQINREDAGTYVCQAKIKGRPVSKKRNISVVVNAPPSVRGKELENNVIAGPEANVSLVCLVDGIPKPNITWTMPAPFDPSHHQFNSDRSQLTIRAVTRGDDGNYICTATNKIAENSATIMLNVFEAPVVFLAAEQLSVSLGENVSVSCNVTGHPQPERHWFNKLKACSLGSSGRVRAEEGVLLIEEVLPSDGGMYSCMAVSTSGNASRDVAIYTQPGQVQDLSVTAGPSSVLFSLKSLPISGGTAVTSFAMQWRQRQTDKWEEMMVPASDPLSITSLKPYTSYTVRLAALNSVGLGKFSDMCTVRTLAIRGEPDSPVLSLEKMKVEGNSVSVPFKQTDIGDAPLLHLNVRYKEDNADAEWKEQQVSSDADSVFLPDLSFGSDYQLELIAVNVNGSSVPAKFNFTVPPQPVKENSLAMTKGGVVGIVMVIFLLVFLAVDATCCYKNRCGLLMFIGVKLFGQKVPGLKTLEEVDRTSNGEVKLKGVSTPRSSFQHEGVQTQTKGQLTEVTCDKAPLTKHEKAPPNTDLSSEA